MKKKTKPVSHRLEGWTEAVALRLREPRNYLHLPAAICKGSRGRVVPLNEVATEAVTLRFRRLTLRERFAFGAVDTRGAQSRR